MAAIDESGMQKLIDVVRAAQTPEQITLDDGREYLVTHNSQVATDVSDKRGYHVKLPPYIKQVVELQTVQSLVDYANEYKEGDTRHFADLTTSTIVCVVDYHALGQAQRLAHVARLGLTFSEEWRCWTEFQDVMWGQLEFARFIEENADDISQPTAGDLLDIVNDLHANRKMVFTKAVRTSSDNEDFEYKVENDVISRGKVAIPTKFYLSIPVYFGETPVEVKANLRWRIEEGGGLKLGVALARAEFVRQSEFKRIVEAVGFRTSLPTFYGSIKY